jgi:hypothetical protein
MACLQYATLSTAWSLTTGNYYSIDSQYLTRETFPWKIDVECAQEQYLEKHVSRGHAELRL